MEEEASLLSDDEHATMSSTAEVPTDGVAGTDGAEQPAEDNATAEAAADAETPTADAPAPAAAGSQDTAQAAGHEAAEADASKANPADTPSAPADAEAAAQQMPGRRRLTLVLRYVVNPASLLPLYSAMIDMDLHPHLGQPLKVGCATGTQDGGQQLQTAAAGMVMLSAMPGAAVHDAGLHHLPACRNRCTGVLTAVLVSSCRCRQQRRGPAGSSGCDGGCRRWPPGPLETSRRTSSQTRPVTRWQTSAAAASLPSLWRRQSAGVLGVLVHPTMFQCAQLRAGCLASFVSRHWP